MTAKPPQFRLDVAIRPNILSLEPYRCARDDYDEGILLDANENAMGHSLATQEGDESECSSLLAAVSWGLECWSRAITVHRPGASLTPPPPRSTSHPSLTPPPSQPHSTSSTCTGTPPQPTSPSSSSSATCATCPPPTTSSSASARTSASTSCSASRARRARTASWCARRRMGCTACVRRSMMLRWSSCRWTLRTASFCPRWTR